MPLHRHRIESRRAASIVEVLVVISILGLLAQILLPAVNEARETARKISCKNNGRQLAIAALIHTESQGFFPSGGWCGLYTADPKRRFGKSQPGGWAFSLLPFLEEKALYSAPNIDNGLVQLHLSSPGFLYCPTRRRPKPYPLGQAELGNWKLLNAPELSDLDRTTKSDYAANSGDALHSAANDVSNSMWWPQGYDELANVTPKWTKTSDPRSKFFQSGISFYRSEIADRHVKDGMSKTYLIGEKLMDISQYEGSQAVASVAAFGDNESAWVGFEWDNHRVSWQPESYSPAADYQPQQDSRGLGGAGLLAFGSAHAGSLVMSFCDGSVHDISYSIDKEIHRRQSNRLDGTEF